MKKLIFFILCVLVCDGTAHATGYTVSGKVYEGGTNATVGLASGQMNCTWGTNGQCSAGGSFSSSNEAQNHGQYSYGWLDCGPAENVCPSGNSCVGRNMYLTASKNIGGLLYSGSVNWVAAANTESKNIYIYRTFAPGSRDDLVLGSEGAVFVAPGLQLDNTAVIAFDVNGGDTTTVTGYQATLAYDQSKLLCTAVYPVSPFSITYSDITTPGVIEVEGSGGPVTLGGPQDPTVLFTCKWNVMPFETVDYTNVVTDPNNTWLTTPDGPNNPILSNAQYKIGESNCPPYFRIADFNDWTTADANGRIYPMDVNQWEGYITQWQDYNEEGEPYPDDQFKPATLYVYEGNEADPCGPKDAGLVMGWGDGEGSYSSAWVWDYKKDPDLSNCTINLVVTAPQFGLGVNGQVNKVSFGLQNPPQVGGPIRSWDWNCGAAGSGAPITWGVPTRLTINTALTGVNAATPTASAYANNPGFNLKVVQWLLVDENGTWIGGPNPVPGPGGFQFLWNYWHWVIISPNTTLAKNNYKKWSQPAVVIDTNDPPLIQGWDECSDYNNPPIVADDWKCIDDRPITDIHWWGSFIGWNSPDPPPVLPKAFHIGIWSDVPDPNVNDYNDYSHPGQLLWEHFCDNYVMNFAGYDVDPRTGNPDPNVPVEPTEACFQFNQLLSQKDWFYQENDPCDVNGTVYWLSISAVWDPCQPPPPFDWGWKTRAHYFNDDAVQIQSVFGGLWPPVVGSIWGGGIPIQYPPYWNPDSISFDMAFELTTNRPSPDDTPASPDLNFDGTVNLSDLAILADRWLSTVQY
jgi:hypothetical protein